MGNFLLWRQFLKILPRPRRISVVSLWRVMLLILAFLPSLGAEEAKNPLQVKVLCDHSCVRAGGSATLGLLLQHPVGYHSYWRHPGVVGVATSAQWSLPPGFHVGEMQWPAPQKVMMSIHPAQGYKTDTLLMVPLEVESKVAAGKYRIGVTMDWMCCAKGCFPGHAVPFEIVVQVGAKEEIDAKQAPLFAQQRALVPKVSADWRATFREADKRIVLEIKPLTEQARALEELGEIWFFSADGAVDSSAAQHVSVRNGVLSLECTRYQFGPQTLSHLSGVLHASKGWDKSGKQCHIEIHAPRVK